MKESTTARGYGAEHQRARRAWAPVVAAGLVDCWRCGERIPADAPWDLGHDDLDRTMHRGPEHQRCNRATKGRRPNQPASVAYQPRGRTMTERRCEVCAADYRPSYSGQRTCGRLCGAELWRRNRPAPPPKPAKKRVVAIKICSLCGTRHTSARRLYCSDDCMLEANARRIRDAYRLSVGLPVDPDEPTEPRVRRATQCKAA